MATEQERLQLIYQIARKAGLDDEGARVAVAIARTEGGLSGAVGDNGASFGPYQFYTGGQLPNYAKARGLSVQQAGQKARTDIEDAAEWALTNYLGAKIKEGQAKGLSGAQLATYAQRYGQVSVNPEKAGQNYAALYGQGGSGPTGGNQVPTPTADVDKKQPDKPDYLGGLKERLAQHEQQLRAAEARIDKAQAAEAAAKARASTAKAAFTSANRAWEQVQLFGSQEEKRTALAAYQEARDALEEAIAAQTEATRQVTQAAADKNDIDTRYNQTQGRYDAETLRLQQISQDLKDNYLNDQLKLINAGIAAGNLDARQADDQWQQVLAQANAVLEYEMGKSKMGLDATRQGYDLFLRGAGRMGTQADADALAETMKGWGPILGREIEPVRMGVQPFTPREDMARYAPPAPDWQAAQQALTSLNQFQPSPGGGGPIDVNARLAEAQGYLDQQGREPQGAVGTGGPPMGPELTPRAQAEMPNEAAYEREKVGPWTPEGQEAPGINAPSFATLPPSAQEYVQNFVNERFMEAKERQLEAMQQGLTNQPSDLQLPAPLPQPISAGQPRPMPGERRTDYEARVAATRTPTPVATATPTPTPTPAPNRTATPVPTRTPRPSGTPVADPFAQQPGESLDDYMDRLQMLSQQHLLGSQP